MKATLYIELLENEVERLRQELAFLKRQKPKPYDEMKQLTETTLNMAEGNQHEKTL